MADDYKRTSKGTFAVGNKGGGRKKYPVNYSSILATCVTAASWKRVVKKAIAQAESGDKYAREWLSDRLMGKAPAHVTLDSDGQPSVNEWLELARAELMGENGDEDDDN